MVAIDKNVDSAPRFRFSGALADVVGAEPTIAFGTIRQGMGVIHINHPEIGTYRDTPISVRLDGAEVGPALYDLPLGPGAVIDIGFAVEGAGTEGAGKVVLGGLLMAASFLVPGALPASLGALSATSVAIQGAIWNVGFSMLLGGVDQYMLSKMESPEQEQRGNGQYGGPQTAAGEGYAIPLLYGRSRVGGVVIQRAIDTVAV